MSNLDFQIDHHDPRRFSKFVKHEIQHEHMEGEEHNEDCMPQEEPKKKTRLYYADWCRAIGIHVVLIEHCINSVDTATGQSMHNYNFKEKKEGFFRFLVQFGIPIFFFISGIGASYFNTERPRAFLRYSLDKILRLVVPLIFAILIFLIPRHYFGQSWDPIGRLDNETTIEWDFSKYVPAILGEDFIMKLGPLWFLPTIFIVMMINYPLLKFSKRRASLQPLGLEDAKLVAGQVFSVLVAWNTFTYCFVEDSDLYITRTIPASVMLTFWYLVFFGAQTYMASNLCSIVGAMSILFIGIFATISFNYFHPGNAILSQFGVCMMHNYHMMFFAQGIIYNLWYDQIALATGQLKETAFFPIWIMINIFSYGIFMAGPHSNTGFYFVYPLYIYPIDNTLFVIGTWQIIYSLLWLFEMQINEKFDGYWYSLINRSSMFVYISHDFWQTAIISGFIYPNVSTYDSKDVEVKKGWISISWALIIVLVFSDILCILNYLLFEKLIIKCMRSKRNQ